MPIYRLVAILRDVFLEDVKWETTIKKQLPKIVIRDTSDKPKIHKEILREQREQRVQVSNSKIIITY